MNNKIQKQLDVLKTNIRWFGRPRVEDHLRALDLIGELGTPYDARYILPCVFSNKIMISKKAGAVVRKLLTKEEVETAWVRLYGSFFDYYGYNLCHENRKKIEIFPAKEKAHLFGIASLNHNGHVREEALGCLQTLSTSEALPYILLRLNDWVPQVRAKAKEALTKVLPSMPITDLMEYYSLIEWLGRTKRIKLKDVQENICAHISDIENRDDMLEVIQEASFRKRLFCWKTLADVVVNDPYLVDNAIADPAPAIRQWAASNLPEGEDLKDRLVLLLSDRAVRVRYAALRASAEGDVAENIEFFENAIYDDSKPIREYARYLLSLKGISNYADRYRNKLLELKTKANPGLVAGLAEVGTKEDISLINGFIDHKNSRIRASALVGLNRLRAKGVGGICMLGLQDNSAKVRKVCISILQSGYEHLKLNIENLLKNGNVKSQISALKVLSHSGALSSLQNILFALTEPHEELQGLAWRHLASWHHQYGAKLWFKCGEDAYWELNDTLNKLRKTGIEPPGCAREAWNDLPSIMKGIRERV